MFLSFERLQADMQEMLWIIFVVTLHMYKGTKCHKVLSLFNLQHWQICDCMTKCISCTFNSRVSQSQFEITVPQFWLFFEALRFSSPKNFAPFSFLYLSFWCHLVFSAASCLMNGKFSLAVCPSGFRRKEFRGKLAIAITANFINRNTTAEAKVEEISGVAFIFNQRFFQELRSATGIEKYNV